MKRGNQGGGQQSQSTTRPGRSMRIPCQALKCGGWREAELTPLGPAGDGLKPEQCVPPPLIHRTPKRWRAGGGRCCSQCCYEKTPAK